MEKHRSELSAKRRRGLGDSFHLPQFAAADAHPSARLEKPSRDDITRCINIWATVYRLRDSDCDETDLQVTPRNWTGRTCPGARHFE